MLKLRLDHDQNTEDPCEYSGWRFVSFHQHSRDRAADYIESVDRDGRIKWANIGLARKVETEIGRAHV